MDSLVFILFKFSQDRFESFLVVDVKNEGFLVEAGKLQFEVSVCEAGKTPVLRMGT